jgi:hypothetical protein
MPVHERGDVVGQMAGGRRDPALERVAREDDLAGTPGPSVSSPGGLAADQTQRERSKWHFMIS